MVKTHLATLKGLQTHSIVPFAAVGAVSTLIDIVLYKGLLLVGIHPYGAAAFGFLAGLTNGYLLNSRYSFQRAMSKKAYSKYFIVSAFGLLFTELIIGGLHVQTNWLTALQAKLVAVMVVFFWNYGLSKRWVFR